MKMKSIFLKQLKCFLERVQKSVAQLNSSSRCVPHFIEHARLLLLFCIAPIFLHAQAHFQLESTFGNNGQAIIPIGPNSSNVAQDRSFQIAQQSDGKIILAGYSNDIGGTEDWIMTVIRLLPSGALDHSFGVAGVSKINFAPEADESWAVDVQPDDKIVITGRVWDGSYTKMGVVRLKPNGQLDPTFDTDGKAVYSIGALGDEGFDLAIQPDGKILSIGRAWQPGGETGWAVMRLLPGGQLDLTFNGTGKFYFNSGFYDEIASCIALQEDGKILLGGSINQNPGIIRLLPDGSFDPSFNLNGISIPEIEGSITSITLDNAGRILYSAYRSDGICKTGRLMPDGTPDPSFGTDGITLFNSNQNSYYTSYDQVMVLPDGKILGLGSFESNELFDYYRRLTLLLLDANGKILDSFISNPDLQFKICYYDIWFLHAIFLDDGAIGITSSSCSMQINYDMLAVKLKYDPLTSSFNLIPLNQEITIFPNPTTGEVRIDNLEPNQASHINIYDSFGRLHSSKKVDHWAMNLELPEGDGVYFIQVGNVVKAVLKANQTNR